MTLANQARDLVRRWLESSDEQLTQFSADDINGFLPVQTEHFLSLLLNEVYKFKVNWYMCSLPLFH